MSSGGREPQWRGGTFEACREASMVSSIGDSLGYYRSATPPLLNVMLNKH